MSLDIRVYKNKKECESGTIYFDNEYFLIQLGSLKNKTNYDAEYVESLSMGSYSGYGYFRESIFSLLKHDFDIEHYWTITDEIVKSTQRLNKLNRILDIETEKYDFVEILNFSDCEGVIDTAPCKKLYNDFNKYKDTYMEYNKDNVHYIKSYEKLMYGLKIAGENNGFILFS